MCLTGDDDLGEDASKSEIEIKFFSFVADEDLRG